MLTIHEYLSKFCESSGITLGSKICAELMSQQPDELVSTVYSLLAAHNEFAQISVFCSKSAEEAELYLDQGVVAYADRCEIQAVHYQTMCLALAPPNTDKPLIPVAYAQRSAALHFLERFSASLMDANRALKQYEDLSIQINDDLLKRRRKCVNELKKLKIDQYNREKVTSQLSSEAVSEEKDDETKKESAEKREADESLTEQPTMSRSKKKKMKRQKKGSAKRKLSIDEGITDPNYADKFPLPLIEDPNEMIPSASAKVNISFSEAFGRHLVAADDIKPGELLIVERPFASMLFPQFYHACCRYCYVRCEALIACPKCLLGTYCSESCRSKAFDEFHRVECPILYTIMKLGVIGNTHLALRLLLIATKQGANLSFMMQDPTYKSPLNIFSGPIEGKYSSEDYKNVHNLMDNRRELTPFNLFRKCFEVAILLFLLKHTTFFGRSEEDKSEVDVNNLSDAEIFTGTLLLKFLLVSACNGGPITELIEVPRSSPEEEEIYRSSLIGYGLYPLHSLLNHSCDANSISVSHKDSVVCYASQPIKKGEQIFSNYHWSYTKFEKSYRQSRLQIEYFFKCKCKACEFGWGSKTAYEGWPLRRISNKISEKEMKDYERKFKTYSSREGLDTTSQEDFDYLVDFISVYHKCVKLPCQTYMEALEYLSLLLAKRGNCYEIEEDLLLCQLAFLSGNREIS